MISDRAQLLIVEQVGHELRAHQLYLGMALYFERQNLMRWGKLPRAGRRRGGATRRTWSS